MPMATAPSPNDLTRQQLDELDALLQRMLSLPLNPPEVPNPGAYTPGSPNPGPSIPIPAPPLPDIPVPPAVKNWRVDPPAPAPAPVPHLLAAPVPEPPPPNPAVHAPVSPVPTPGGLTFPSSPVEREAP